MRRISIKSSAGFTLLELMAVVAVIAILALLAMPSRTSEATQIQVVETLDLLTGIQQRVGLHYAGTGTFPADNETAGVPAAESIIGNYLTSVEVRDGALHLALGNKVHNTLLGKTLSLRPVYVAGSAGSPVSWVCGFDEIPAGMTAAGENLTDVPTTSLPGRCR